MKKFILALAVLTLSFAACTTPSPAPTPQPAQAPQPAAVSAPASIPAPQQQAPAVPVPPPTEPLRLVMPVTISASLSAATDFAYERSYQNDKTPLSNSISGTPKVEVAGDRLTIELDSPHTAALRSFDSTYTVTPAYAKYYIISGSLGGFSANVRDNAYGLSIGIFFHNADHSKQVYLIYADFDVTVNGTITSSDYSTAYANVTLKAGWNFIICEYNSSTSTIVYSSATQTMPSGFSASVVMYQ
jgi:hypothetical protein